MWCHPFLRLFFGVFWGEALCFCFCRPEAFVPMPELVVIPFSTPDVTWKVVTQPRPTNCSDSIRFVLAAFSQLTRLDVERCGRVSCVGLQRIQGTSLQSSQMGHVHLKNIKSAPMLCFQILPPQFSSSSSFFLSTSPFFFSFFHEFHIRYSPPD